MKTALQELLDELDLIKIVENHNLFMVKYIIEQCLEKEKEQIIDAYCNGYQEGSIGDVIQSDEYFDKTYNQNK
jgi:hypothetical protein